MKLVLCLKIAIKFLGEILPQPSGFLPNLNNGGGNKQDESRWNIFDKMGNTGGIIQGDNSAGYCFVLRHLGSINKKLLSRLVNIGR